MLYETAPSTCIEVEAEPVALPEVAVRWRKEVQRRGKYWQWRKGSGAGRTARYGGKFDTLEPERKVQYVQNVEKRARRAAKRNGPGGAGDAAVGDRVLSGGGIDGTGRE